MRTQFRRIVPLFALVGLTSIGAGPALADEKPTPAPIGPIAAKPVNLPPGVVARVRGRDLTDAEFEARLVERLKSEWFEQGSSALGVFQFLVEWMVVLQEAQKLGIRVTTEDYDREYAKQDDAVRAQFRGEKTLADLIREQEMAPQVFRERIEDWIRKERIAERKIPALAKDPRARVAQVEVVIADSIKKAIIEKDGLPVGLVAKVNGEPVTVAKYGNELRVRLAKSEIQRHLGEICITMLIEQEGLPFTSSDVDRELEFDRPMWERMRTEALTAEKRELPFDGFIQLRYNASTDELHKSPYRRGIFALRRRIREGLGEDDVLKAWTRNSQTTYGPSIVVTDILVSFEIPNAVSQPTKRRTIEEARRIMADFARRLAANEPLKTIEAEIKARGDSSMLVEHRAVIHHGNDRLVYEAAMALTDGQWSTPWDTLSAMHLVRREKYRPAPTFDEVKAVVRQHLVDEGAQLWLQDRMRDDIVMRK